MQFQQGFFFGLLRSACMLGWPGETVISTIAGLLSSESDLSLSSNGDVVLCEKRRHDKIIFGNLNQNDFNTIWTSDYRQEITKKLVNPCEQKGCATCRITSFNRIFYDLKTMHTKNFI